MPRRGLVVLISDLYYDPPELLSALDHFRHFGHDVLVFHLRTGEQSSLPVLKDPNPAEFGPFVNSILPHALRPTTSHPRTAAPPPPGAILPPFRALAPISCENHQSRR